MNKILIIGHENSHYKDLEQILYAYGIAKAKPSYIYQMTPIDLGNKLLSQSSNFLSPIKRKTTRSKSENSLPPNVISETNHHTNYYQKQPKKIWDNLAFDLFLANSDQPLWGWADSNAISLLEYWANFDDEIGFILTYDEPSDLIKKLLIKNYDNINESLVKDALYDWVDYNQVLLDFYKKYPSRCLLVNGKQAIYSNQESIIQSITNKITSQQIMPEKKCDFYTEKITTNIIQNSSKETSKEISQSLSTNFLIDELLSQYQIHSSLFAKIQNLSDTPFLKERNEEPSSLIDILKNSIHQQKIIENNVNKINNHINTIEEKNKQLKNITKKFENEKKIWRNKISQLEQENYFITAQLHKVQEEIEYLQVAKEDISQNQKIEQEVSSYKEKLEKTQKEVSSYNDKYMLFQLHKMQEELENYSTNSIREPEHIEHMYIGAADRIRQDLPYRLGSIIVRHSKSIKDYIRLPSALIREFKNFKKNEKQENLIPIEMYYDVYEAEKLKKHLSYRLGVALIDSFKLPIIGIFCIPFKFIKEIVQFNKEKK